MGRKPPATPPGQHQQEQQHYYPGSFSASAAARPSAVILDVFGEGDPLHIGRVVHAALPAALLKTPHPLVLFQSQRVQIAAYKSPPEDAARKFVPGARLERANMLGRHLGGFTDGLERHSPRLACRPQLPAECRHSALLHHASFQGRRSLHTISDRIGQIKGICPFFAGWNLFSTPPVGQPTKPVTRL